MPNKYDQLNVDQIESEIKRLDLYKKTLNKDRDISAYIQVLDDLTQLRVARGAVDRLNKGIKSVPLVPKSLRVSIQESRANISSRHKERLEKMKQAALFKPGDSVSEIAERSYQVDVDLDSVLDSSSENLSVSEDLSVNDRELTQEEKHALVEKLPKVSDAELIEQIAKKSVDLSSYDLSECFLGYKNSVEIAALFAAISDNVKSLNLSDNKLSEQTGADLAKELASLSPNLSSLDLSFNALGNKTASEWAEFIPSMPVGMTSLDLYANNLSNIKGDGLADALKILSPNLKDLNLGGNSLGLKSVSELSGIIKAISHVESLNLSANGFAGKTAVEFADFLKCTPASVTSLDIGMNGFEDRTDAEKELILAAIPKTVLRINVDDSENYRSINEQFKHVTNSVTPERGPRANVAGFANDRPKTVNDKQAASTNYSFQFKCLAAIAAIAGAAILVAAVLLLPPIGAVVVGVGLAVGARASHGFFGADKRGGQLEEPDELEGPKPRM